MDQPRTIGKTEIASILSALGTRRRSMAIDSFSLFSTLYMGRIAEKKSPQFHYEIMSALEHTLEIPSNPANLQGLLQERTVVEEKEKG